MEKNVKNQTYRISSFCEVKSGKRLPLGCDFSTVPTEYKYIRARDIKNGKIDISDCAYIDDFVKAKIKKYIIEKNDIAITVVANIGDVGICDADADGANLTENAVRLTNFNSRIVFPKYLAYYLAQPFMKQYMEGLAIGAAQAKLGIYKVNNISVELPSVEEQEKIANIINKYDNLIENNNKRIKILEQMAENLYKEWFVRFRFPGHEITPLENGIPKGWKLKHVSEIGDIIGGGTPSTDNEEYWNGNIPWLSPADLTDYQGVYIDKGANNITELGLAKSSAKMMPKDTVLLSSRAPIGYVALAKNDICTNQGFKSIVCNQSIMKPSYLYLYFKLNKSYLQSFASGATFPELSGSMVKKLKVLVPDISLLEKFDTFAKKLFEKTDVLLTQNQNLIKQRDLLLPRLMSGKLAV